MWKDYSVGFIKKNRASSISIMVAAFISTLFLSFLCSMFYNVWVYEVEKIVLEEGDWQGRLAGEMSGEDILTIQNFANVEKAAVNEALSGEHGTVVDVNFYNARTIFEDMPLIAERLGLDGSAVSYHGLLLSRYLIHDPMDESPPLLLTFYLVILLAVSLSLILVIHNSFAVSMNARVHQFGILSSIGATPRQILTCLMQEAAALCVLPVFLGSMLGIALSYGAVLGIHAIGADMIGRYDVIFRYHFTVFAITILSSALTVLCSAWLPARKLSRLTPLEAIRGTGALGLKRKRSSFILRMLFGMEGELAGNALKAQKKALHTSTLSLTFSFLGFTMMLCLFSLTDLSTKYTYFEAYQDVWDVMAAVKNTDIRKFELAQELRGLDDVRDCAVYQKAEAICSVPEEAVSVELNALGGPGAVAGASVAREDGVWLVKAPIVVLDDDSFAEYCRQIGIAPGLDGTVVLNRFWDSLHSNFRYREYVPFLKGNQETVVLHNVMGEGAGVSVPVVGFTQDVPVLKEEYADYTLAQFMPLSLWREIGGQIQGAGEDTFIRILADKEVTLDELNMVEENLVRLIGHKYEAESENRIQDKITNDNIINGYKFVLGSFCSLLAIIGIANVFSYTLSFLRQRRQEFAQYMSVGMTPAGMRKMFCAEDLVIAGRPILITLPLSYLFVEFTAKASYLNSVEVWPEVPVEVIAGFCVVIVGFVGMAYYIGGKRVLRWRLAEALREDGVG